MTDFTNHENFVLMNNVNHRKPRIYLAGKVTNAWWRSKILPGFHGRTDGISIMYNGWFYEEYWFLTEMAYKYTVDVRPDALKNFFNETVEELNTNIFVCKK